MEPNRRLLPVVLGLLTAFGPLTIDMYLPALPKIQADLQTTTSATQLSLSAYFAGLASTQLFYGPLADRFGRRRPLLVGMVIYIVASLLCAVAPSIWLLIAARFFQAAGGAAGPVISRAVVRDLYRGPDAARFMSLLILVMGVAPIVAPMVGSAMLASFGWRSIFVVLALLGAGSLALTGTFLPETGKNLSTRMELRLILRDAAIVLRERQFLTYTFAGGFAMAGMFAYIAGASFVFMKIHQVTPNQFALIFGVNAFGIIFGSQVNHRLLGRFSPAQILSRALVVTGAASVALVIHGSTGAGGFWLLSSALFVFVGSLGFIMPNASALAMEEHGPRAGLASALLGSLQFLVAAVSSAFVGAFDDGTARPMTFVMAGCVLLAASCLWFLRAASREVSMPHQREAR